MSVENDFLPVATQGTPNVASQVAYAGATEQQQGFADGEVPTAKLWNKMMRQATFVAAMLAGTICALTGQPMVDDGALTSKIALLSSMFRYRFTAAQSFYVSTSGNDSAGDGSSGNPWATVQHAVNYLMQYCDFANQVVTIVRQDSVAAYTDNTVISGRFVGQSAALIITASASTNVTVSTASSEVYKLDLGAAVSIQNQKITNSIGNGIYCTRSSQVTQGGMNYGAIAGGDIVADRNSTVLQIANNNVSGNAAAHVVASSGADVEFNGSTTTSAGLSITTFVECSQANVLASGSSFPGSAVIGTKFVVTQGAINTNGAGINLFPGSIAGTQGTGGTYV